jgi:hypothetical protein
MATGRIPGPCEGRQSLGGRVINKPSPLGLNWQPTAWKSKPAVIPPKPNPKPPGRDVPTILNGKVEVTIQPGTIGGRYVFTFVIAGVAGDAFISVVFQGSVRVPTAGVWEIGLVQNLEAMVYEEQYDSGGKVAFFLPGPLLDTADGENDIWFTRSQEGFVAVTSLTSRTNNVVFRDLSLSINDVTDNPGIMFQQKRCRETIVENIDTVRKSMFFRAAVVARKEGKVFQLAATERYGFSWLLDVPNVTATADPSWLTFDATLSSKTNVGPGKFESVELTGARANDLLKIKRSQSLLAYEQDCSKKPAP